MIDPNFRYLQRRWFTKMPAEAAFKNFSRWRKSTLARILRHHNDTEAGISDSETWRRDEFDYLLGYYSIVELGSMLGFFSEIPASFRNAHLPVLRDSAMRRYYEWHYPLDLPRRLRERMQSGMGYSFAKSAELNAVFLEFLELTKVIEQDEDVESFLWTLDGGWREDESGDCDFEKVKKGLASPARFARAVRTPPKKRGELDRALNGFYKFIQFCEGFSSLIARLKKHPEIAEAMWLAHAYWFRQLDTKLGAELQLAIRSLAQWQVGAGDVVPFKTRINEMLGIYERLAQPPLAYWSPRVAMGSVSKELENAVRKNSMVETMTADLPKVAAGGLAVPASWISIGEPVSSVRPSAKRSSTRGRPEGCLESLVCAFHRRPSVLQPAGVSKEPAATRIPPRPRVGAPEQRLALKRKLPR